MRLSHLLFSITMFVCFYTQAQQTGTLTGRVVDESSAAFPDVIIELKNTPYNTLTGTDGFFRIENIPSGKYILICKGACQHSSERNIVISNGEETFIDIRVSHKVYSSDQIVVTATRTEKDITEIPTPVKVIGKDQIRQMGSLRLNEVLAEQTGLAIVTDHGTGIQMQGMNPEYTLILLDGEPFIGRTAGTFDLTRIAVGNINRIEIIKGPSSSLYGSEALAGVINIITSPSKEGLSGNIKARFGTNTTTDFSGDLNFRTQKFSSYFFADRYSTSGYDLSPETEGQTVSPFSNYTFQTRLGYKLSNKIDLSLSGRYFTESQKGLYSFTEENVYYLIDEEGGQYDWNLNPVVKYNVNDNNKITARFYNTFYHTNSLMTNTSDGGIYDESFFNQNFTRPEVQYDHRWSKTHQTTAGGGIIFESVSATRYTEKKYFQNTYGYLQHDFSLWKKLYVIAGTRYDQHSVYGSQLSPKVSLSYKLKDWFAPRVSVGRGFKAPDFRQLYLNFTNPVAGYSVFGSEEVQNQINVLQQQGQISQILIDPSYLKTIQAEHSTAYNAGWISQWEMKITWQVNFFRNDIHNLIESAPVAIKTNNQSVYTYFNIANVYTQGVETDISYRLNKQFSISAGYQYLEAKDKQVLSDLDAGKYYTRDPITFVTTKIHRIDYGGLFNRSRHMSNVRLFYSNTKTGWEGSVRAVYRGRYGYGDVNGNLILDQENEYVKGYWMLNVSASKRIFDRFTFQAGIDNILNFSNAQYIASIPGRLYYMSVGINLKNKTNNKL